MPPSQKRITVGIPSFNEEFNISRLLHSIIELNKLGSNDLDNQNNSDYKNDDSLSERDSRGKDF